EVREVTLALDNDEAGRSGIVKALDNAQSGHDVPVVCVVDPAGLGNSKDPDEFVRKEGGTEAFRELLERRAPGAVDRAILLLEGIQPTSPIASRQNAAERVLEFSKSLHGPRAEFDRKELLRLVARCTGYPEKNLLKMLESTAGDGKQDGLTT